MTLDHMMQWLDSDPFESDSSMEENFLHALMWYNHIVVGSISSYWMLSLNDDRDSAIIIFSFNILTKVGHYIDHGSLDQLNYFADLFSSHTRFAMTTRFGITFIFLVILKRW